MAYADLKKRRGKNPNIHGCVPQDPLPALSLFCFSREPLCALPQNLHIRQNQMSSTFYSVILEQRGAFPSLSFYQCSSNTLAPSQAPGRPGCADTTPPGSGAGAGDCQVWLATNQLPLQSRSLSQYKMQSTSGFPSPQPQPPRPVM